MADEGDNRGRAPLFLALIVAVGLWPMWYALSLSPVSRDDVVWITRSALQEPRWWDWVFRQSHFVGYRPLTALSFTLDSLLGGYEMLPYRATDILLHAMCAAAIFSVYRRLAPSLPAWGGLSASALFLLHPVTGLVVPHLARRSYSLATLLSLVGLSLVLSARSWRGQLVALLALLGAALSNEAAVTALPIAAAAVGLRHGRDALIRALGACGAAGVALLALRYAVIGGLGGYEVDEGASAAQIAVSTWEGLIGLATFRDGVAALPEPFASIVVFGVVSLLVVPSFAREIPRGELDRQAFSGGLLMWGWLLLFTAVYLPQGVFFPRQLYMPLAPLSLAVGIASALAVREGTYRQTAISAAISAVVLSLCWQSPVLWGIDPAQRACWRQNDRMIRQMGDAIGELPPRSIINVVAPYYKRPSIEALRAHDEEESRMAGRHAMTWLAKVHDLKFGAVTLVSVDPRRDVPSMSLRGEGEGVEVVLAEGASLVKTTDAARVTSEGGVDVITPEIKTSAGRPAYLYFDDGLSGRLTPLSACEGCGEGGFKSRADERYPGPPPFEDAPLSLPVPSDDRDGTLSGGALLPDGRDGVNTAKGADRIVVSFDAPAGLGPILSASLELPVVPKGGSAPLSLTIRSAKTLDAASLAGPALSQESVEWLVGEPWPDPFQQMTARSERTDPSCAPLQRRTPDLAPLLARREEGDPIVLVIEATAGELAIWDSTRVMGEECEGPLTPLLDLSTTLRSTLQGKELLSRPTARAVTLSLYPRLDLEVEVELWPEGAEGERKSFAGRAVAGQPLTMPLDGLSPDTSYRYRLRLRRSASDPFEEGPERSFHTARPPGSSFVFTMSADVHLLNMEHRRAYSSMHLLKQTMARVALDEPDFHIDLGDSFNGESYRSYDAPDTEEIFRRHLDMRPYFERISAPILPVLGNHEGEQGWRVRARDPLPDLSSLARAALFPGPPVGDFYSGLGGTGPGGEPLGNCYAFTWGDVLFVALDPYRYTEKKPHKTDGSPGTGDRWDWTLGEAQYQWLVRTLEESDAPFKLVFAHQVTGGTNDYGRGGRLAAKSFEWGAGPKALAKHRPGWPRSIHRVLADTGVTAFLHGHDHVFAFEPALDGVSYITVPQPGDAQYDQGHGPRSDIAEGSTVLENSGYLRFTSSPGSLSVEYIRSFLPGDGEDGQVAFRYDFAQGSM